MRLPLVVPAAVLCAFAAHAEGVNPVRPEAAKLLAEPARCIAFAEEVADTLAKRAKKTEHGLTFGAKADAYGGDAGVAVFFFSLYRATRKKAWLALGRPTLAHALATGRKSGPGLYTGVAGIGEACLVGWRATGDKKFLTDARACAALLGDRHEATDVIFGAAGTGIFLLNLHAATGDEQYRKAARAAGDYLARTAIRDKQGARWPIVPRRNPKVYVGFSHGAAGIGYFFLHLHRVTKEKTYRELAEEAARFVRAHAIPEGTDGAHWERTVPPTPNDTIRVQWCHGAPGNGLFFAAMDRHLGGAADRKMLQRCVATTRRLGRTARRSGGQCHGVSGNAELFVEASRHLEDPSLLASAREFGSALLEPSGKTYRVRMRGYGASYMNGLAGIGHYFLRLADPAKTPLPFMVAD